MDAYDQEHRKEWMSVSEYHAVDLVVQECIGQIKLLWAKYLDQDPSNEDILIQVIDLERNLIQLYPERPDRHVCYFNLGLSLWVQYVLHKPDQTVLKEIVDIRREGIRMCPVDHQDRYGALKDLASSLLALFQRDPDEALLTEAINITRESLHLRPRRNPDHSWSCIFLSELLLLKHSYTGDMDILTEAIEFKREVLRLQPQSHSKRHHYCANLAGSLMWLYEVDGNENVLTEVISNYREAFTLCDPGHPYRHQFCENLANSLSIHYTLTQDQRLLTEAIDLQREALALRSSGHEDRHDSCEHLAKSLELLYMRTRDGSVLTEAIELNRETVELRPMGHPDRHVACANLASCLGQHHLLNGDLNAASLDEAIAIGREALELQPPDHPQRYVPCGVVASLLLMQFNRTGDESLLSEALSLHCEGLTLTSGRVNVKGSDAIELSRIHLLPESSHHSMSLAIHHLQQSLQHEPSNPMVTVSGALEILEKMWAHPSESMSSFRQILASVYEQIIQLLPLLVSPAFDLEAQLQRLRQVRQAGVDAFIAAVLVGDKRGGLQHLEVTQSVIWAQRVRQRDRQFHDLPHAQATELYLWCGLLSSAAAVSKCSRDELHDYSARMYAVIRDIRSLPGLDRFMLGETYETMRQVAVNHPAVVLVGARGRFYAFIITSDQLDGEKLLELHVTEEDLKAASNLLIQRPHRGALVPEPPKIIRSETRAARHPRPLSQLDRYLQFLWMKVVKPILDVIKPEPSNMRDRPRLHWCPTGPFTNLPFHAAGWKRHNVCCADYVVSSYTPTLTSLLHAQQAIIPLKKKDLDMMLVAECRPQEKLPTINGVTSELHEIADVAKAHDIKIASQISGSTTVAGMCEMIQEINIAHIACHGIQDHQDATKSGFCLGDGRLTIHHLSAMNNKQGFLAFLSACETAQGSKDQPDQAMHLAAAMLFAGFKSVVATMWAISDGDGPKVAKWFYEDLFTRKEIDADAVAYALDYAVGKLRSSGVKSDQWVPFIHMGA